MEGEQTNNNEVTSQKTMDQHAFFHAVIMMLIVRLKHNLCGSRHSRPALTPF